MRSTAGALRYDTTPSHSTTERVCSSNPASASRDLDVVDLEVGSYEVHVSQPGPESLQPGPLHAQRRRVVDLEHRHGLSLGQPIGEAVEAGAEQDELRVAFGDGLDHQLVDQPGPNDSRAARSRPAEVE